MEVLNVMWVLSVEGNPLMPTKRHGKVRCLLKQQLAKVVKVKPFTIQLLYETTSYTQNITRGIDSGYNYIGLSAVTEKEELICGEVKLRNDISELLKERRMYRRIRRNRLRYRKPRFDNRISSNESKKYSVQGVQNKSEYIKLMEMSKPVKTDLVKPYMFRKGFSMFYNSNSSPTYRSGSLLAGK